MLNQSILDQAFHALADPTRRAIVKQLSLGPASVSDLAKPFDITLAAVLQHLQILERSGVVQTEKTGRTRSCRLAPEALSAAEQWIAERRAQWERRFDHLETFLAAQKPQAQPRKERK